MADIRFFPPEEFEMRIKHVRDRMAERGLDALLIASPENLYYLTGLNHQGYFAYQMLILPLEQEPILITRAMERAIVQDMVPEVKHVCFSDGIDPLPPPEHAEDDLLMSSSEDDSSAGLNPWSMSLGVSVRSDEGLPEDITSPTDVTCKALKEAGLSKARLGLEKDGSFFPYRIAAGIVEKMPEARWEDAQGIVDNCRILQSPLELKCTRKAAEISDTMMLAAIAAAGPGVYKRDVMASVYQTMFQRGGTYPGFIPLVRSTRTLAHEHGTWDNNRLHRKDMLFVELAGCVWRYHAPIGRLLYIGKAPGKAYKIHAVCREALQAAIEAIKPGVLGRDVYQAWQGCVDRAGLSHYRRHHCGYSVGIGFPPSWSGSGVPLGLRANSTMELRPGMVFHLLSWLLRTGKGDSFLSNTVVVTEKGCEPLSKVPWDLVVR